MLQRLRLGRGYHSSRGPSKFGAYAVLDAGSAMTTYPEPLFVPEHIRRPYYVPLGYHGTSEANSQDVPEESGIALGTVEETSVRKAARLAADILSELGKMIKPGVTTADIDRAVHEMILEKGAYPSPLGYSHFPKSCTTSVNNVIAHGIPDDRLLLPDDLINVDLTIFHSGYHGDTSRTFCLSEVDKAGKELVEATEEALDLGIRACRPGQRYSEIGTVIEQFAHRHGFSINTQFSGHGIGTRFHQEPWILHHRNSEKGIMKPGDCFTVEPILVQGYQSKGVLWDDGWTVSTESGGRAAQAEHQILITEDGAEILTS